MGKRKILAILVLAILLVCVVIFSRIEVCVEIRSPHYVGATLDMLINNSDYIALVEIRDSKSKTTYSQAELKTGFKIRVLKETNTYTDMKLVTTYKGNFEGGNVTYMPQGMDERSNFEKGQQYILFMKKNIDTNMYYLSYGIQGKFIYNSETKSYYNFADVTFEDMKSEIERYNNTPEEERDLLPR